MCEQIPEDAKRKFIDSFEADMPEIARVIDSLLASAQADSDARTAAIHPQYEIMKAAIENGESSECARLLSAHPELAHAVDEFDDTLLQHALWRGNTEAAEALCRGGSDPNRKNKEGLTPITGLLTGATNNSNDPAYEPATAKMIRLVCSLGACPDGLDRLAESPPLYYAAIWNLTECARALLDAGANVNKQQWEYGNTPLHCAGPDESMVRLLLERGADPWIENWNGHNALQVLSMDFDPSNYSGTHGHDDQKLLAIQSRILELVRAVPRRKKA